MMKQWWENFPTDDQPQQGGIVTKPADPARALEVPIKQQDLRQGEVQIEGGQLGNQKTRYEVDAKPKYDRFGALDKLTDNVRNDPRIKTYESAVPIWASALSSPDTAEADNLLVNAIAKVGDPMTGVQQREGDAYQGAAPAFEQVKARLLKEFGSDGAGNFTTEGRRRMKEAMTNRMKALATGYNSARGEWRERIKASGIPDLDPETVLGKHFGGDFQQYEANFKGAPVHNLNGSLGATPPTMSPEQVDRELQRLVRAGDRAGAQRLIAQYQLTPQPGDLDNAFGDPRAQVVRQEQPQQPHGNPLQQLGNDFLQIPAGIAEGLATLPDMAAQGAGQVMAAPFSFFGLDNVANELRKTPQIGRAIEQAVPVPQDWNGWGLRQASRLGGGVAGMPAGFTNRAVEQMVGAVPKGFNPANAPKIDPKQVYDEARSLGIEPTANAVGGPTSRTLTSLTAQTIGGAGPTIAGARRMVDQGGQALGNIAGREGASLNREAMGQAATSGAIKYRNSSRDNISRIYDAAAAAAGDTKIVPSRTLAELDRHLGELGQIPMGGEGAQYLQSLRDDLTKFSDGLTVDGLRGMRTQLRQKFAKDGLRGSDIERRVDGVVETVTEDIAQSLIQAGKPEAANLYRQADAAWAERVKTIDDVIMPIIGRKGEKSGEQVAAALKGATRGNGAMLHKFLHSLPESEAGDVRASLIEALGAAKPGVQDADGGVFSFNEMLTNWNNLDDTARSALFSSGDRSAMDKLARVAAEVKDAARYANHSNSGGVVANSFTLLAGMSDPTMGVGVVGGSWALGKALASPGMASLIARIGSIKTPGHLRAVGRQMEGIAKKYPGAAPEIFALRDTLIKAVNDNAANVSRAAASGPAGRDPKQNDQYRR